MYTLLCTDYVTINHLISSGNPQYHKKNGNFYREEVTNGDYCILNLVLTNHQALIRDF